jgi:hypothetical protein
MGGVVPEPGDLVGRAENFASTEELTRFVMSCWLDPDLSARFEERPRETLAEFGIKPPEGLDVLPLGTGQLGKPGPGFEPFEIRFSRCKTVVVRDDKTGRLSTETVCFGIEIVPTVIHGGPA